MEKGKKASALMRPVQISEALAAVIGPGPMPRTEVTKKLWAYIKKHGLQDPREKRFINPDPRLAGVIGNQRVNMFDMTKKVSMHIKEPAASHAR
jgi:chromatin remodeling complex protein RSC6